MANGRSHTWVWVLIGLGGFLILFIAAFTFMIALAHGGHREMGGFGDKIAVVDLEGVILEPHTIVKQLKEFNDDDSVKAIILHVNTPGGGAAASQEIYTQVR